MVEMSRVLEPINVAMMSIHRKKLLVKDARKVARYFATEENIPKDKVAEYEYNYVMNLKSRGYSLIGRTSRSEFQNARSLTSETSPCKTSKEAFGLAAPSTAVSRGINPISHEMKALVEQIINRA